MTGAPADRGTGAGTLFLLGFLTLFLELVLIRYLAGNIWNLGYFPNLVLIAVFVGMGSGFLLHHRWSDERSDGLFRSMPWLLLALVVLVTFLHPVVPGFDSWKADLSGDLYFTAAATATSSTLRTYVLFAVWFLAVLVLFLLLSQRTAKVFRGFAPLRAYTLDIIGSCAGIVTFMLISWLRLPAFVWFEIVSVLVLLAAPWATRWRRWVPVAPLAVSVVLVAFGDGRLLSDPAYRGPLLVEWSPYQKLEYIDSNGAQIVFVNGINHQAMRPAGAEGSYYAIPYAERAERPDLPPYRDVLILGAGTGNDVAAALANGARHVDAVEIDPGIAEVGERFHPDRPYADPRVTLTITDGRAFLSRSRRSYDLIVFALTDSLVKVSPMSQLRLENYLFTEESIARAYELLTPDGDLLFYNFYRQPWLEEKIRRTVAEVAGAPPRELYRSGDFALLAAERNTVGGASATRDAGPIDVARDDWPFLYLRTRGIPGVYVAAMGAIAFIVFLMLLLVRRRPRDGEAPVPFPAKLAFVGMGVAFLLLETKSVIQFSLLFGTTWLNNSLVFLAVLLLVLAANRTAGHLRRDRVGVIFGLLIASCLTTLVFPLSGLLTFESAAVRFVLASLLTFAPIYFANLVFGVAFRDQVVPEHLFGWNLIGATLGGALEYASLAIGYNDLALIVAACYAIVFLSLRRRMRPPEPRPQVWSEPRGPALGTAER